MQYLLKEVCRRTEIKAFVDYLCEGLTLENLSDAGTAAICGMVVEPFCRRLDNAVSDEIVPSVLVSAIQAISPYGDACSVSPIELLGACVIPYMLQYFSKQLKLGDADGSVYGSTRNSGNISNSVILQKTKDLLVQCFGEVESIQHKLSLADGAALSRSSWLISRYAKFYS